MIYRHKNPAFLRWILPNWIWKVPTRSKVVYLTFDDGPIPEVTPWVLSQLAQYQAKASFFVVGDNVRKHPEVLHQVFKAGHRVGNHTYNHLSGWKLETAEYLDQVTKCQQVLAPFFSDYPQKGTALFRPPYMQIRPAQSRKIRRNYHIVMWDVIAGDWDKNLTAEDCYQNTLAAIVPGSIVVLHDSLKAWDKLQIVLPRLLSRLAADGWAFEALD